MPPKKFDVSDDVRALIIEQIKLRDTRLFGQGIEAHKINEAWEEIVVFSKRYNIWWFSNTVKKANDRNTIFFKA